MVAYSICQTWRWALRVRRRFGVLSCAPVPVMCAWCPVGILPTRMMSVLLSCFRITTGLDLGIVSLPGVGFSPSPLWRGPWFG